MPFVQKSRRNIAKKASNTRLSIFVPTKRETLFRYVHTKSGDVTFSTKNQCGWEKEGLQTWEKPEGLNGMMMMTTCWSDNTYLGTYPAWHCQQLM
jgi:hypothetical protein